MKLNSTVKKRLTKEWNDLFPCMGIYKNMWLMNICGPLAVGILLEVKSDKDRYIPTLHIHNLCEEFPVISLAISLETKAIKINDIKNTYLNAADELKSNTFIPLSGDVVLTELIEQLKKYYFKFSLNPDIVLNYLIYLAAWSGKQKTYDHVMEFVDENIKDNDFYTEWSLPKSAECSEQLHLTVQEQEHKLKTLNLPHRNLIV